MVEVASKRSQKCTEIMIEIVILVEEKCDIIFWHTAHPYLETKRTQKVSLQGLSHRLGDPGSCNEHAQIQRRLLSISVWSQAVEDVSTTSR